MNYQEINAKAIDVMEDINSEGNLHDHNIPTCWATRAVKQ